MYINNTTFTLITRHITINSLNGCVVTQVCNMVMQRKGVLRSIVSSTPRKEKTSEYSTHERKRLK